MKTRSNQSVVPLRIPLFRGERRLRIALIGMPNAGKNTLFNAVPFLTGLGCNVPAISGAAKVTSGRERVIASALNG